MNKITLELLCRSVFDYECEFVNNPDEPPARAYEGFAGLQTGSNIATFCLTTCVPGGTWLLTSRWSSRRLKWSKMLGGFPGLSGLCVTERLGTNVHCVARVARLLECMNIIREITRDTIHQKVSDASGTVIARKDVMRILIHARQNDQVDFEGLSADDLIDQFVSLVSQTFVCTTYFVLDS